MARHNQRDILQALLTLYHSTFTIEDDGALYEKFLSNSGAPVFPSRQKTEDTRVGDGSPYPRKGKPYYFDPINRPFSSALTTHMGVRLLRLISGGVSTPTAMSVPNAAVFDHVINMKTVGTEPLQVNVLAENGGQQFLNAGVFVQNLEISQQLAGEPQMSASMSNNGHYVEISDTTLDTGDIAAVPSDLKFHGAKTTFTFSDGVDSYDFVAEGRLVDLRISLNQNVVVEGLPGDSFIDDALQCQGAYAENFFIDVQSGEMNIKVYMDDDFDEFQSWLANRTLTSVKATFKGCEIIGTSAYNEIEVSFAKAEFELSPDTQGNFDAFNFAIKAIEGDAVTGDLWAVRVRSLDTNLDA